MSMNKLFWYVMALITGSAMWWLCIRIIFVIVNGTDKSLLFPALAVGALAFFWVQATRRLG